MRYFNSVLITLLCAVSLPMADAQEMDTGDIGRVLRTAYEKFKDVEEGANADYIKELAKVPSDLFGIVLVTTDGEVHTVGDVDSRVSIQSISKAFVLAKVIDENGPEEIEEKIGVDATGEVFNSITAVERMQGREINPLVNPGAIAATSMLSGDDYQSKWNNVVQTLSAFAGERLEVNEPVYISEAGDNLRNQAVAHLLKAYGRMYFDPVEATDIYTKQCAMNVNARNLGIMAGTLANGGFNPVTKEQVVSAEAAGYTMAVMATAGLYDDAGIWLYETGVPAKSGVGGGIVAAVPGKFGIAAISPPLDKAGNSVKAQLAIKYVIANLEANPFLVKPDK